jgi:hypothetical protein
MSISTVYLSIDGVHESLEVDLTSACVAEVVEAFGFLSVKTRGGSTLSPRLTLRSLLKSANDCNNRLYLEGVRSGVFGANYWHM